MIRTSICKLLALGALLLGHTAHAQDYPTRPLRLVTTFAPGSVTDVLARVSAQKLTELLGQQVLVENQGGAAGLIATRQVLAAQPPGYSLLYATNGLVGNQYAYRNPGYKLDDFIPLGATAMAPYAMMVNTAAVPVKTLAEFIAYAKANPGKLNYGSIGPSAVGTLMSERLKAAAGIDMTGILFKGGDPAIMAMMAGDVHVYFATVGTSRSRVTQYPQIRALGVGDVRRAEVLPEIPTFREQGFNSIDIFVWNCVFVPASAPRAAVQKLQAAMGKVVASPELTGQTAKMGMLSWPDTLEKFTAYIRSEGAAVGEDFRRLKLPVQD